MASNSKDEINNKIIKNTELVSKIKSLLNEKKLSDIDKAKCIRVMQAKELEILELEKELENEIGKELETDEEYLKSKEIETLKKKVEELENEKNSILTQLSLAKDRLKELCPSYEDTTEDIGNNIDETVHHTDDNDRVWQRLIDAHNTYKNTYGVDPSFGLTFVNTDTNK